MPSHRLAVSSPRTLEGVERFLTLVEASRQVVILTHNNPDPDSIASAAGLRYLISKRTRHDQPVLAFGGLVGRAENQQMIRGLALAMVPAVLLDFSNFDLAILADTRRGCGTNALPEDFARYCEFDHHDESVEHTIAPVFSDIRRDYGATSTIITEYLRAKKLRLPEALATALLYGVKADTQNLNRMTGPWDAEAYMYLFKRANIKWLHDIEHPPLPRGYFKDLMAGIHGAQVYGNALVADLGNVNQVEIVAEMADTFMRLTGMEWALCMGYCGEDLALSMRTSRADGHAGVLMRSLVEGRGVGGGHQVMAGGRIGLGAKDRDKTYARQTKAITQRFLEALGLADLAADGLVPGNGRPASDLAR